VNTEQQYIHELNKMRVELEDYYNACAVMNLGKHDNLTDAVEELMLDLRYVKSKLQDDLK